MPLTPTATRELLASLGHSPKKFLGQNFLVDGNIVRKSLELAQVAAGDDVVEIGPGLGTLTSALLEAGARVWAVERDARLYAYLVGTLGQKFSERFHLIEGDALEFPLAGFAGGAAGKVKVVANLPYAISTPWMDAVLSGALPERMVLMLQQEAAQRYTAAHGSKLFGAISIFLQGAYVVAPGHRVSAGCFYPRPDVESVLLHLVRRERPFVFAPGARAVIRACFQQRRKQLGAVLRRRVSVAAREAWFARLAVAGISARARAEEVPAGLWEQFFCS